MKNLLKKRSKNIQKAFNSNSLILKMLQDIDSTEQLNYWMSIIFSYYLCSFDKKNNYTLDELMDKNNKLMESAYKTGKSIIEQRYYFQAFNGCYEETFKKNGLDDISNLDFKVKEAFELLEKELGRTRYGPLGGESNDQFCSFITPDPYMVIRYALSYSPERLWFGPLDSGFIDKRPPIKIGESKTDYMMRIIESKIQGRNIEERNKILEAGKVVCEEFGSKRPRIAIIPEDGIKDFFANYGGIRTEYDKKIEELAQEENYSWTYDLKSGANFGAENGIAVFGKITGDKFLTITIPDAFELIQMFAIERGAKLGDLVDSKTGKIISRSKENNILPAKKDEGLLQKAINKIKQIIRAQSKVEENETNNETNEEKLKKYKNLRSNKFRRNRNNVLL